MSIVADALAAMPAVVKSFNDPETESAWPYFASTISAILTLLTVTVWNVANIAFPLYIVLITLLVFSLVQFKPGKIPCYVKDCSLVCDMPGNSF